MQRAAAAILGVQTGAMAGFELPQLPGALVALDVGFGLLDRLAMATQRRCSVLLLLLLSRIKGALWKNLLLMSSELPSCVSLVGIRKVRIL